MGPVLLVLFLGSGTACAAANRRHRQFNALKVELEDDKLKGHMGREGSASYFLKRNHLVVYLHLC